MVLSVESIAETLEKLDGGTGRSRRELEGELLLLQKTTAALLACPAWLNSPTLFWHVGDGWSSLAPSLRTDIISMLVERVFSSVEKDPASKKLLQVLVLAIINAYPKRNLLTECLELTNWNQPSQACAMLEILAELPLDLNRISGQTNPHYAFKHSLVERSAKVYSIVEQVIAQARPPAPVIDAWLRCFSEWSIFCNFRKTCFPLVPKIIAMFHWENADTDAAASCLIAWLESDVHDLPLINLLPDFISLQTVIKGYIDTQNAKGLIHLGLTFRIYGEMICDDLVGVDPVALHFLQIMTELTRVEYNFSSPSEADTSLFWVSYCESLEDCDDQEKVSACTKAVIMPLFDVLCLVTMNGDRSRRFLDYRDTLAKVFCAIHSAIPIVFFHMLFYFLPASQDLHSEWSIWAFSMIVDFLPPDHEKAPLFIDKMLNLEPADWPILYSTVRTIKESKAFIYANSDLQKKCAAYLFKAMHTSLQPTSPPITPHSGTLCVQALGVIMTPDLDQLVFQNSNLIERLSDIDRLLFWSILCDVVERTEHKAAALTALCEFCWPLVSGTVGGLQMLTVLLRKVKIARFLHRVPPLDDMLSFVTQRETSCQDPLFPEFCEVWETLMESMATEGNTAAAIELLTPVFNRAGANLNIRMAVVLYFAVGLMPSIAPSVFQMLLGSINMDMSEGLIGMLVSLLTSCMLRTTEPPLDPRLFALSAALLQRISSASIDNDFLRQITDFLSTLQKLSDGMFRAQVLGRYLLASGNFTDSQIKMAAPLLLDILATEPLEFGRLIESTVRPGTVEKKETLKKLLATRTPDRFAELLFCLLRER